jgi:hypothetical protein
MRGGESWFELLWSLDTQVVLLIVFFLSLDVSGSEIWYGSFLARKGKEGVN